MQRTLLRRRSWALVLAALLTSLGCGGGGTPSPDSPDTPKGPTTPDVPDDPGTDESALLDILSRNPTEIRLDGKKIGTTPINGYKVSPGTHDVTFVFTEDDAPTLSVTLGPGESQTVKLDPPPHIQEGGGAGKKDDKKEEPKKP
jgi:hypothetical protein